VPPSQRLDRLHRRSRASCTVRPVMATPPACATTLLPQTTGRSTQPPFQTLYCCHACRRHRWKPRHSYPFARPSSGPFSPAGASPQPRHGFAVRGHHLPRSRDVVRDAPRPFRPFTKHLRCAHTHTPPRHHNTRTHTWTRAAPDLATTPNPG
jgi:hypothetical protein